jgi:hypothetical protein
MPLIPRDNGGEIEISIDGDSYWLKRYLGWYDRRKASEMKGVSIHVRWGQVQDGVVRIGKSDLVPITMDAMEDVQLAKLQLWLSRWSHSEPMNQNTIRRIPEHVADKLLQEIAKLEGDQDGPAEDSPLAIESAS